MADSLDGADELPVGELPLPVYKPVLGRMGAVELHQDFHFQHYFVQRGTIWDGQSVPRWLWPVAGSPFDPLSMPASLIHDELYRLGRYFDESGTGQPISRLRADGIFYDLCIIYGVPIWAAYKKYLGLRVGGWVAWRRHRRKREGG